MATDQEIRDAGFKYIPQQKYLQNPYELPIAPVPTVEGGGIPNTNAFTNSGNDFSVYNPDPNSIVNKIYKPNYDYRQDREINSKTFNPQPYGTGAEGVQAAYNQANQALAQGMDPNSQGYGSFTGGTLTGLKDIANNMVMDNRQNYGAEGQYVNQYDPRYSSETEAQKFMDNFPEYYTKPEPTGAEKIVEALSNFIPGRGIARFVSDYLPANRRSIMENELGGKGIMVNNIGQIVQGEGAYDTSGNVMAGYNPVKMTAKTFDKRIANIENTLEKKYGSKTYTGDKTKLDERIEAIKQAKQDFLDAEDESNNIYDFEKKQKKKRRDNNIIGRFFKQKKQQKEDDRIAKEKADAATAATATGGVRSSDYNQAANERGGGGGNTARNAGGQTAREATYDGNPNTGTSQGYSQHYARGGRAGYFFGGRVNFKDGGLASIL